MDRDFNNNFNPTFMDYNQNIGPDMDNLKTLCLTQLCNMNKLFIITVIFVCKWIIRLSVRNTKNFVIILKIQEILEDPNKFYFF